MTGKRIFLKRQLPAAEVINEFSQIPASNVADVMERTATLHPRIRLLSSPQKPIAVGVALTVKTRAGDNLVIHQALDMIVNGDVLVVSNEADETRSLAGEIMLTQAFQQGAAAVIFDGPIRDYDAVKKMNKHVYATGCTPGGPYKNGPGEINVPISCGEEVIFPGDILLCDFDGVVIIPRSNAKEILSAAKKYQKEDVEKLQKARDCSQNRDWVKKSLIDEKFIIIDDYYKM